MGSTSTWAFRFLLFYIVILCVQPQNRFTFLHPLQIGDISIVLSILLHFISHQEEDRSLIRLGPGTITALLLMFFSFISLHSGAMMSSSAWNSDIDIIYKNCTVLILIEAMATSVRRVWAVQATLFLSVLWWLKGGLRLAASGATYSGDRLMGPAVSLIENPNGFAYMLAMMTPLYLYFYQQAKNKWLRLGCLAGAVACMYLILETGSRTGVVALGSVAIFLLPKYGSKHKLALVAAVVSVIFLSSLVGSTNIDRFKTIPLQVKEFLSGGGEEKDPAEMDQDEQSAWERKMKNRHTWALIKEYPLFGVGIQADDRLVEQKYHFATGQVHNEILYAGKQMGIIGMMLYLSLVSTLFLSGRYAQKEMNRIWPAASDLGWTMKMQSIVLITGGFFAPIAWNAITMILVGSASALYMNIKNKAYA